MAITDTAMMTKEERCLRIKWNRSFNSVIENTFHNNGIKITNNSFGRIKEISPQLNPIKMAYLYFFEE